jgi:sugar lactone lactonase YvrE
MVFDSTDLVVTTETQLLKFKLSTTDDNHQIAREVLAELAGGSALGLVKYGRDYVILACGPGCPVSRLYLLDPQGIETTLFETANSLVEVRVYRDEFIVSDITANQLLLVDSEGHQREFSHDKLNGPAGMAVDGEFVWVTNFFSGELLRIDSEGQAEVIASGLGMPVGVQYDGKDFIVADFAGGEPGAGRVLRVAKNGRHRVIAQGDFIGNPSAIVLQGNDIYVSDILSGKIVKINTPRLAPIHSGKLEQ